MIGTMKAEAMFFITEHFPSIKNIQLYFSTKTYLFLQTLNQIRKLTRGIGRTADAPTHYSSI